MGSYVLRGITTALFVTVLTLFAGIIWSAMGFGGLGISNVVDIGLLASCVVGGYRTAKESKLWFMGGAAAAGYVVLGTLLLALFLPIRGLGFIQVLAEGTFIGLVAGAFGAGNRGVISSPWNERRSPSSYTPYYAGYGKDDDVNDSNKFEWDSEDQVTSSESQCHEVQDIKRDSTEDASMDWPWDREKEDNPSLKGSKQVRNDLVVWDQGKEKALPWWEQ